MADLYGGTYADLFDEYEDGWEFCPLHDVWFEIDEGCIECDYDFIYYDDPY